MQGSITEGLEAGEWLQSRDGGLLAPGDALAEVMDSDRRLHANIGGAPGVLPVVDDVTGEPIAWVPSQGAAKVIQLAGRIFEAERTEDAIRVRERTTADNGEPLRYATRKAPMMRSALRHLALGLGLAENALVRGRGGWTHFGGSVFAAMLRLLGMPGGPLASEGDPRRASSIKGLEESCRRNWGGLETVFEFGPFQHDLPADLRQASVMDSLPVQAFTEWIQGLEEVTLTDHQERVLYGD